MFFPATADALARLKRCSAVAFGVGYRRWGSETGARPILVWAVNMAGEAERDLLSRRGFLGVSSAALAAASVLGPDKTRGQENSAQIPKGERSASDPAPKNSALDAAHA